MMRVSVGKLSLAKKGQWRAKLTMRCLSSRRLCLRKEPMDVEVQPPENARSDDGGVPDSDIARQVKDRGNEQRSS